MTAVHPVVRLQVTDDRFDGLSSLEQSALCLGEALVLAPVLDVDPWILVVHTTVAKIDVHVLDRGIGQNAGLLELLGQFVTVVRIVGETSGAQDEILFERAGDPDLHAELVGFAGFALGDHFDLWGRPAVALGGAPVCQHASIHPPREIP